MNFESTSKMLKVKNNKNNDEFYKNIISKIDLKVYIIVFFIASIIGWGYETILSLVKYKEFKSMQALLIGPFIPVYGFGSVVILYTYSKVKNMKLFFLISMFVGAFVEFLYSFIQESLFSNVSWDYTEYFLNIQGRTSIVHAIFWGIISFLFIKFIIPLILKLISYFSNYFKTIIAYIIIIFMFINFSLTLMVSKREYERNNNIASKNKIDEILDKYYPNDKLEKKYFSRIRK